jgi:hypothetical protein
MSERETREQPPIRYRDRHQRAWYVSEVARVRVVSASIDGPSHFLVIRFEREGEERFARWIGGDEWIERGALHRLFAEAEPVEESEPLEPESGSVATPAEPNDAGVGPAPPETIALWVEAVRSMGPDELSDFEERTFRQWDPALLGDVRSAIERRRKELKR